MSAIRPHQTGPPFWVSHAGMGKRPPQLQPQGPEIPALIRSPAPARTKVKEMTKTRFTATLTLAMGLGYAATLPVHAQSTNCGPHDRVVAGLATGYGESRQSIALGSDNTVVETFASEVTGTWTITVTTAGGPTCLVASGQSYQYVAEALPNTDPAS